MRRWSSPPAIRFQCGHYQSEQDGQSRSVGAGFDFAPEHTILKRMSTAFKSSLTILFEAPFWIGLYERTDSGKYEVCKITFGSEPKDYEVYEFLLKNWHKLKFSPPIQAEVFIERKLNPKRMQREIQSQLQDKGVGTKAQQALKLQHEQCKL